MEHSSWWLVFSWKIDLFHIHCVFYVYTNVKTFPLTRLYFGPLTVSFCHDHGNQVTSESNLRNLLLAPLASAIACLLFECFVFNLTCMFVDETLKLGALL